MPAPEAVEGYQSRAAMNVHECRTISRPQYTDHNPGNFGIRRHHTIRFPLCAAVKSCSDLNKTIRGVYKLIDRGEHASAATGLRKMVRQGRSLGAQNSARGFLEPVRGRWYWENEKIDPDHRR